MQESSANKDWDFGAELRRLLRTGSLRASSASLIRRKFIGPHAHFSTIISLKCSSIICSSYELI